MRGRCRPPLPEGLKIVGRFDLVMFDLDGTLVETAPEIADATNDTLRAFGWPEASQAQVEAWIGHGTRELLIQAVASATAATAAQIRDADWLPAVAATFDRHYAARCGTRSRPYPHARELLQRLRAQGVRLAVVTNKERRYTESVLNAHALTPMLDRVISGDTLPRKKPDPSGVEACLIEFGVTRERALFVGDSSIDVATARNAGVAIWLLPHGYNMGQPVADARPDAIVADFTELAAALDRQGLCKTGPSTEASV